ncbi:hypothetical protein KXV81_006667 [Aspergillus fumigatus]|nr:hypothetical protein KXX48_009346 [Aspergillus fumigatus]KAH2141599.1 hypothetical protein KXV35_003996 [Aspergillus fumigatus]KAH2654206.1 hypothetical protein KXV79_007803 [Aspergillus fumigatus]KAH3377307.1 hypothetical protein KXW42_006144 [Aspergillus fumigatus]KAH3386582.1 hypothetical protein KXV81_006667 [Aspergillus fumigatus]
MTSLGEAKDASSIRLFQLPVARAMAAQLVQAVEFLHSQGIVHGDLHDGNVLVRLPGSRDSLSPEQLYEKYGSPRYEPVAIIAQRPLFEGYNPSADWVIKEQVDCLGKLPAPWWLKWDARAKWFNEDGERKIEAHSRPLEQRFDDSVRQPREEFRMDEVDETEKVALLSMLKAMRAFNPEERPTAQEVLNCEWMQKWALPEFPQFTATSRSHTPCT